MCMPPRSVSCTLYFYSEEQQSQTMTAFQSSFVLVIAYIDFTLIDNYTVFVTGSVKTGVYSQQSFSFDLYLVKQLQNEIYGKC